MPKLTLKKFISELDARLEKFSHAELKRIIRDHAMNLSLHERGEYLDRFVLREKSKDKKASKKRR